MTNFNSELGKILFNFQSDVVGKMSDKEEIRPNEVSLDIKRKFYISAITELVKGIVPEEEIDGEYIGFCTECRFKIKSFEGLIKCPNCSTNGIPCSIENNVKIKINWHELSILCMWAERWGMQIQQPGIIYGIAHAIEKQYPDKGALTLAGQVNEVKKEFPDAKLYDGKGKEIQT